MWVVDRWAVNSEIVTWYFCKECFPTKEDVLNEIDTDECHFGIAYVDHPYIFEKKDNTRMYASKPPIPNNK